MKYKVQPTNKELVMKETDFIVSKTDTKGLITYANRIFMEFAGYKEEELLGKQHNIIRHPDMPRGIYKLLWSTIQSGQEIFAYVKNMANDGAFYWTFANVTPVYNEQGTLVGYYSVRRKPLKPAIDFFSNIYREMIAIEKRVGTKDGMAESLKYLNDVLGKNNSTYEETVYNYSKVI